MKNFYFIVLQELNRQWVEICNASSPDRLEETSPNQSRIYSPLSLFHVYVLSQICKRVITVVGLEEGLFS